MTDPRLRFPAPCDQRWEEMRPVPGGRVCERCDRRLVDFREMTDAEIAAAHLASDTPICGAFSPEQAARWRERRPLLSRGPALVTLTLGASLLGGAARAQPADAPTAGAAPAHDAPGVAAQGSLPVVAPAADTVVVRGTVRNPAGRPLVSVTVTAAGTPHRVMTDTLGQYVLRIAPPAARPKRLVVFFAVLGHTTVLAKMDPDAAGDIQLDAVLAPAAIELTGIVTPPERPSLWRRILNVIGSIF